MTAVPRPTDGRGAALEIERQVAANVGRDGLPSRAELAGWAAQAVAALPEGRLPAGTAHTVAVRIVGRDESRALNAAWRERDRPTNVLAFPAGAGEWPPGVPRPLGDIVICAEVVAAEAAEQGKPASAHWCHMLVHGLLHLAGYDHVDDADAAVMEALERRILEAEGLPDPYAPPPDPAIC